MLNRAGILVLLILLVGCGTDGRREILTLKCGNVGELPNAAAEAGLIEIPEGKSVSLVCCAALFPPKLVLASGSRLEIAADSVELGEEVQIAGGAELVIRCSGGTVALPRRMTIRGRFILCKATTVSSPDNQRVEIAVEDGGRLELTGCRIKTCEWPVDIVGSKGSVTISDCRFEGVRFPRPLLDGEFGRLLMRDCRFSGAFQGRPIVDALCDEALILGCRFQYEAQETEMTKHWDAVCQGYRQNEYARKDRPQGSLITITGKTIMIVGGRIAGVGGPPPSLWSIARLQATKIEVRETEFCGNKTPALLTVAASKVVFTKNRVSNSTHPLKAIVLSVTEADIEHNEFRGIDCPRLLDVDGIRGVVADNEFSGNSCWELAFLRTSESLVERNRFVRNRHPCGIGVWADSTGPATIRGNTFDDNEMELLIASSTEPPEDWLSVNSFSGNRCRTLLLIAGELQSPETNASSALKLGRKNIIAEGLALVEPDFSVRRAMMPYSPGQ